MSRHRWSAHGRTSRRLLQGTLGCTALLLLQLGLGQPLGLGVVPARAAAPSARPNHFDPRSAATSVKRSSAGPSPAAGRTPAPVPFTAPRPAPSMKPAVIPLTPGASQFVGSDGALEVDVQAGTVTASEVAAAGGGMSLLVRQVLPASGGSAGGSGHYTFGTFLIQVLDARGQLSARALGRPLGLKMHYDARAGALDNQHAQVYLNRPLPPWFDASPSLPTPPAPTSPASGARQQPASGARQQPANAASRPAPVGLGKLASVRPGLDASSHALAAAAPLTGGSLTVTWDSNVPVAAFGKPDPFEPGLSSGSLSAGYPFNLPAGPGGLTPQLGLQYNSAGVNDQHNVQAGAPWVGEGWNLSLGAISWAERSVAPPQSCSPGQTTCPAWDDTWELSDSYGTAAELIPPSMQVSTYYDDTTYAPTPSPISWHTAPETHARVISYTSPSPPSGMSPAPPCFRVFLPNGIMEEFGCTPDSLQFYPQAAGANAGRDYLVSWLVDLITDPSGNQVHVTYQQDVATAGGISYPRDVAMATVEYDSPGCHNAQAACTGSSWAPLMRVSLAAAHAVAHVLGSGCSGNGSLRCDDPVDLSGSGGLAAPLVQSSFVLNDVQVQVRSGAAAGWSTLRDYRLSYDQTGPTTITDPFSGVQESTAGRLNLAQLSEIGADLSTALPPTTFGYSQQTEYYEDSATRPAPYPGNCGPAWNTDPNNGCNLWSQSYAGNSSYLASVSNGMGLSQSFSWQNARNNTRWAWAADPFFCDNPANNCNAPDDGEWSRIVLTQRSSTVLRLTQNGQGGSQASVPVTSTTSYGYQMTYWSTSCGGCQNVPQGYQGMYWRSGLDDDRVEFYNDKFMGFAQTTVTNPDGSVEVHHFYSTEGMGVYDTAQVACNQFPTGGHWCGSVPWWDLTNAAHMHEYELDRYATDGTTLLQRVSTRWQAICPPSGVAGSPAKPGYGNQLGMLVSELDQGTNPVVACDVQKAQVDTYRYDGSGGAATHSAAAYTYDGYGRVASQAQVSNPGSTSAADSSGHGSGATLSGGVTEDLPGLVAGDSDTATSLDGSSGYVAGPTLTPLQGDSTRSVELWFSTTSRAQQALLDGGNTGVAGQAFQVGLTTNQGAGGNPPANQAGLSVAFAADDVLLSGLTLTDGRPHHVVVTLTGTSLYVYVDGQTPNGQIWNGSAWTQPGGQPLALPSAPNTAANPLWIGRTRAPYWGHGSAYFAGTLDEVAVYDHVLSSARVQAHYGAGSGYRAAVLADAPLAYYRLDDGAGGPGPNTFVSKPVYAQNDSVSTTATSAAGTYLIDDPAFSDVEDTGGSRYQCSYTSYDGQGFAMGQTGGLTRGLATTGDRYTDCGNAGNGFSPGGSLIRTTHTYDAFGNQLTGSDPDANAGNSAHVGCTVGSASYSTCTAYDGTFDVLPTASANALNQTTTTSYPIASTAPPPGPITSGMAGKCVDDNLGSGTPGSHVQLWDCNGYAPAQSWTPAADGTLRINGLCMEVAGAATTNNGLVQVGTCAGGGNQVWQASNGRLVNPASGRCLDDPAASTANGTQLEVYDCNGGANQRWAVPGGVLADSSGSGNQAAWSGGAIPGVAGAVNGDAAMSFDGSTGYAVAPASSSLNVAGPMTIEAWVKESSSTGPITSGMAGKCVDDNLGSGTPGSHVQLWDCNGYAPAQSWTPAADGTLRIDGLCMDVTGGATNNGALVQVWTCTGAGNQVWQARNGQLVNPASGRCLDDPAGSTVNGTQLEIYDCNGGSNQKWTLPGWGPIVEYNSGAAVGVHLWANPTPDALWVNFVDTSGSNHVVQSPAGQLAVGTWAHVVATYDGTSGTIYVNGVQVAQSSLGSFTPQTSYPLDIARRPSGSPNYYFNGAIDEAAVYRGALSPARVQARYAAATGLSYRSTVLADAPAAYYRLDEGGGGASAGFGLWPVSKTDANGQPTTLTYDALGRETSETLPGEGAGLTTLGTGYTVWCSGSAAQAPCVEVDHTQRLNATTTVTSRAFYDGLGHLVETRTPAPGSQDVVRYSFYDPSGRLAFQSVPYPVTAYSGPPGSGAYSLPDSTQAGTTYTYDGLGRTTSATDALSNRTSTAYAVACGAAGTNDPTCYEQTLMVDALGHQGGVLTDGLGRKAYVQRYTGSSSSTYAVYATSRYTYDYAGDLTRILHPDGSTRTTYQYDMAGRKTAMTDPDLGSQTYTYDQDGNLTQSVDARGAAGTIFAGYDGLDRPIWRNTSSSPTGAYDTYAYDSTARGNLGVGRLTSETFAGGGLSGSASYVYDSRGRQASSTLTVGAASYPVQTGYDDAGNVLTQTYPDGETITNSYTAQGWLSGVSTQQGSTTTQLLANAAYAGVGGGFGELTGASLGGGTYRYSASYDLLDRATDLLLTRNSDGAALFEQQRSFNAAGDVSSTATRVPAGIDNQAFCYDEQDRLTWAGSVGTPPCWGTTPISPGSLTAAQYTQSYSYDVLGRLTYGPQGTYTYGDPAHVHAATAIGSTYTAGYDAAGNMTCRAPASASTCAGTQTGAQLGFNNEGELASWQNAPTSPSATASFLYDGQGQRVAQQTAQGGSTTTTVYVGDLEEVATSGSSTTTTAYYYAGGKRIGLSVNGSISYLAADGLGSATETLNGSGSATANQLFGPYGSVRYQSGTMPTSYGFTGQRSDAVSGLDYYGARYYDPVAGQFTSADSVLPGSGYDLWGLSRYAYVAGNPVNRTDPSGHRILEDGGDSSGDTCGINVCDAGGADGGVPVGSAINPYSPPPSRPSCCSTHVPPPRPTTLINLPLPRISCCTTIPDSLPDRGIAITILPPISFRCCSTPVPDEGRGRTMYEQSYEQSDDDQSDGGYVDFAHGTTRTSAEDIMRNGLNDNAALDKSRGDRRPGSFFTVRVDPSDPRAALETAAFWGSRHAGDVCVTVCRLPRKVVSQLEAEGSLVHTDVPYQSVFLPKAFGTVNRFAQWFLVGGSR